MCALKSIRVLCQAGRDAQDRADYRQAEFLLSQALYRARALQSPVLEAKIMNTMGVFAMVRGAADKSIPKFSLALEKVRQRIGMENKLFITIEKNLREAERLNAACAADGVCHAA